MIQNALKWRILEDSAQFSAFSAEGFAAFLP
jgi:hypothetical protein